MLNIIYRVCELETDYIRDFRPYWYCKKKCLKSFLNAVDYAKKTNK